MDNENQSYFVPDSWDELEVSVTEQEESPEFKESDAGRHHNALRSLENIPTNSKTSMEEGQSNDFSERKNDGMEEKATESNLERKEVVAEIEEENIEDMKHSEAVGGTEESVADTNSNDEKKIVCEPKILSADKLYIKNLDQEMGEKELEESFKPFGRVTSTHILRNRETGLSRGLAFVTFESAQDASTAVGAMNRKRVGNKKLYVEFAENRNKPRAEVKIPERKRLPLQGPTVRKETELYIANLDISVDNAQLIEKFKQFGNIAEVRVVRGLSDESKGFAFLCFETHEEAKRALTRMNGKKIGEKDIAISYVEIKPGSKGQNPKQSDKKYRRDELIVKNLRDTVDDEELKSIFIEFGNIIEARVLRTADGESRRIGFVQYFSYKSAEKAVVEMNGRVIKGNSMFVSLAENKPEFPKAKPKQNPQGLEKEKICVSNLPKGTSRDTVKGLFGRFGNIVNINMVAAQRLAFVQFVLAKDAQQALNMMNGHILNSKPLRVAFALHTAGPSHDPFYMPKKPSSDPFYVPPPTRKNKKGDLSIF